MSKKGKTEITWIKWKWTTVITIIRLVATTLVSCLEEDYGLKWFYEFKFALHWVQPPKNESSTKWTF